MRPHSWDDAGPTRAERLVLVSEFQRDAARLVLEGPVFIDAGERHWVDGENFVIERLSGEIERRAWTWGCR